MKRVRPIVLSLGVLTVACGDNKLLPDGPITPPVDADDAPEDVPIDANPLATLDGTGLCVDSACTQISSDVIEYEPRFALFADGATKRRWMQLPSGTQIDTTDMDHWIFPVGTKFWKEFTRDGIRVETRFITKVEADDDLPNTWFFVAYAWNQAQDATTAVTAGEMNANGTDHDIPSRAQCRECHESLRPTRVLGFGAVQLDYDSSLMDLEDLITGNLLTAPPSGGSAGARFPLPGTAVDTTALGYLHANCGHCHNATSSVHDITPIELRLETTHLATVDDTNAHRTAVRNPADACGDQVDNDSDGTVDNGCADVPFFDGGTQYTELLVPQDPASSGLLVRMGLLDNKKMPKIGTETVDPAGQTALTAWINSL